MKYRGQVRNGVVVLDGSIRLTDGTAVTVEPVRAAARNGASKTLRAGTMGALLKQVGTWVGEPGEMDRLLGDLRQMKEAEVAAKQAALRTAGKPSKRRSGIKRKRRP